MGTSSIIEIDARQLEHLNLPEGFLSLVTGTVLRYYGERVCYDKYPVHKPFFIAAYYLPLHTYYSSVLVDPAEFEEELHEEEIVYGRDEPIEGHTGYVISATITNELLTEPGYVGYKTTVVLDSHYEGSDALLDAW